MAAEIDELKQQLLELQSQVAFQEDAVRSLDDALAVQQQEMILLRRQLELLKQRQDEQIPRHQADNADFPQEEKPPHY